MASKHDKTRYDIDSNTEHVRSLVAAGKDDEAQALSGETEELINTLPRAEHKRFSNALEAAGTPTKAVTGAALESSETLDWRDIDGAELLVDETAEAMASGVRSEMRAGEFAEQMAQRLLDIRLRINNRKGVPDFMAISQAARDATKEVYRRTGESFEENVDTAEALNKLMRSVQYRMSDAQVSYIRELDNNSAEFNSRFYFAKQAFPKLSPSEAVWETYEKLGMPLPKRGRRQIDRDRYWARLEAKKRGEELTTPETDPEQTLSTDMAKLHKTLERTAKHIDILESASDETKREVREHAESALDLAKKIIPATL